MRRIFLIFLSTLALDAHSLYIMPQRFAPSSGDRILIAIHSGDSFPNSEDGADPARFISPRVVGPSGDAPLTDLRLVGLSVFCSATIEQPGMHWVTLSTKPRVLELDAERFKPYLLAEGLDWVVEDRAKTGASNKPGKERYSKYAKALMVNAPVDPATLRRPLGLTIEIIPLADPTRMKPGAALPIQVLYRGKPVAGIQVEAAWAPQAGPGDRKPAGRTGADGKMSIPLPQAGRWRLNAVHMERCAEKQTADWESYWASLTFELPMR
jgi:hypothetical protein